MFGGCAGNIAYNLKLLGGDPLIMATIGDDAGPYLNRLDDLGLARDHVRVVPGNFTAQAFITTDLDDNQITAFHPGAMNFSHYNSVADAKNATLAIVAPDGRDGMLNTRVTSPPRACPSSSIPASSYRCSRATNCWNSSIWRPMPA